MCGAGIQALVFLKTSKATTVQPKWRSSGLAHGVIGMINRENVFAVAAQRLVQSRISVNISPPPPPSSRRSDLTGMQWDRDSEIFKPSQVTWPRSQV